MTLENVSKIQFFDPFFLPDIYRQASSNIRFNKYSNLSLPSNQSGVCNEVDLLTPLGGVIRIWVSSPCSRGAVLGNLLNELTRYEAFGETHSSIICWGKSMSFDNPITMIYAMMIGKTNEVSSIYRCPSIVIVQNCKRTNQ